MHKTPEYAVDAISRQPRKLGGMFAHLKTYMTLGAGLHASLGVSRAPAANATMLQRDQRRVDGFWLDNSEAREGMTTNTTGSRGDERANPYDRVDSTDGEYLPVAGYERLRLLLH